MMMMMMMSLLLLLFILLSKAAAAAAAVITVTDFVLVDVTTGKDVQVLQDGSVLRHSAGARWTVRAVTAAEEDGGAPAISIQFDLDGGRPQRVETIPPYFLAGKTTSVSSSSNGEVTPTLLLFESNTLMTAGSHVLTAFPVANATVISSSPQRQLKSSSMMEGALTVHFTVVEQDEHNGNDDEGDVFFQDSTLHLNNNDNVETATNVFLPASAHGSVHIDNDAKVTISFQGPVASETGTTEPGRYRAPSTFADYRLDCHFTISSSTHTTATTTTTTVVVPGFYTATTDAAVTGARAGSVWQCIFRPSLLVPVPAVLGHYTWRAVFVEGTNVAANGGGDPAGFFHQATGTFEIAVNAADTDMSATTNHPLWRVVDHSQLVRHNDKFFLALGPNAPALLHPLGGDAVTADDTTTSPVSKVMDTLKYLSSLRLTSIRIGTFLPLDDDGSVVSPFVTDNDDGTIHNKLNYDVSLLAQWQKVLEYASDDLGLVVFVQVPLMDNDEAAFSNSEERKLYARELVARFGHLQSIVWDLGRVSMSTLEYFQALDPYQSPIRVVRNDVTTITDSLLLPANVLVQQQSRMAVVVVDKDKNPAPTLWKNIMADGGHSILHFDVGDHDDFRDFETLWIQSALALEFLEKHLPAKTDDDDWQVVNDWVSGGHWCTALDKARTLVVYKHHSVELRLTDLAPDGNLYAVQWFDPVNGGSTLLIDGDNDETSMVGAEDVLQSPNTNSDWVALLRCSNCN